MPNTNKRFLHRNSKPLMVLFGESSFIHVVTDSQVSVQFMSNVHVKLSAEKRRIGLDISFKIMELNWCESTSYIFDKDKLEKASMAGLHTSLNSNQLNNLAVMHIQCFVQETMDVSDGNTYFEWKANNHFMQQWKNAKHKRVFSS
eukprot:631724_1